MPEWKNDKISIDVEYVVLSETVIMVIGTWNNHFVDSEWVNFNTDVLDVTGRI